MEINLSLSTADTEVRFARLPEELRAALAAKMRELTVALYEKVVGNVSGTILKKQNGKLADSIKWRFNDSGDTITGEVFVDPVTPKSLALEYGGKRFYPIVPIKKDLLHFFWEKIDKEVWLKSVNHPPSKEFRYLRSALEDMLGTVEDGIAGTVAAVIEGGSR